MRLHTANRHKARKALRARWPWLRVCDLGIVIRPSATVQADVTFYDPNCKILFVGEDVAIPPDRVLVLDEAMLKVFVQ